MWSGRDNARELTRLMHSTFASLKTRIDAATQRLAGGFELDEQSAGVLARDLDALARLAQRDPQMRDVLAGTHEQLGDLALRAGRTDDARGHYAAFAELAAAGSAPTPASARAQRKLGIIGPDWVAGFEEALATGEALLAARTPAP